MAYIKNNLGGTSGGGDSGDYNIIPEQYYANGSYVSSGVASSDSSAKTSTATITATATKDSMCIIVLARSTTNTNASVKISVTKNGVSQSYAYEQQIASVSNRTRCRYYAFEVKAGDEIIASASCKIGQYGANQAYLAFV